MKGPREFICISVEVVESKSRQGNIPFNLGGDEEKRMKSREARFFRPLFELSIGLIILFTSRGHEIVPKCA